MSDYAIIFQILGVLFALFFIFLTVMNFKTWRWLHALTTFALFCAVVTFVVYAALAMKTRLAWEKSAHDFGEALARQEKNVDKLLHGDLTDAPSLTTSLTYYRSELARAIVDRGRVWRNCTPAVNPADGTVTLTMNLATAPAAAPLDPAAPAGVPPAAPAAPAVVKKHGIDVGSIVFAFKEAATPEGLTLPAYYVGEFRATAVTDAAVTLAMTQTFIRGPVQATEIDASWMLYEVIPPDAHEPFDFPLEVRAAELAKLAIPPTALPSYARDGGPADANDDPDNVWVRVKFIKSHEIVVDASTMVSPVEERHFDANGQAQISRLARSIDAKTPDPVKFAPNDTATFDKATADDLFNRGIVERQGLIYRRRLNDYEHAFQVISRKVYVLAERATMAKRDTATVNSALAKANEQIMLEEAEKALLDVDHSKVTYEKDETKKYADVLAARVREKRAELSRLYNENKRMHEEIEELNRQMTEEVERRTREATALAEEKK